MPGAQEPPGPGFPATPLRWRALALGADFRREPGRRPRLGSVATPAGSWKALLRWPPVFLQTMLTAISMSAIATNGVVPGKGCLSPVRGVCVFPHGNWEEAAPRGRGAAWGSLPGLLRVLHWLLWRLSREVTAVWFSSPFCCMVPISCQGRQCPPGSGLGRGRHGRFQ